MLIHIDPVDLKDNELNFIKEVISAVLFGVDEALSSHDIRISKSENRIYFDLEMPYEYQPRSKELVDLIKSEIYRKIDYKLSIDINYK